MRDYRLGGAIRTTLQQQGTNPGSLQTMEARLPNLVSTDQRDLLPALSYLLRSRALVSALAQPSGHNDGRMAARLLAEVQAQYSPAICQRLQSVIQGLLALPEKPVPSGRARTTPVIHEVSGSDSRWVVALLCFLIGIVGSGLLLLLWQQQNKQPTRPEINPSSQPSSASSPTPPAPAEAPVNPANTEAPVSTDAINAAVASIQDLYAALSAKDYASAANHFGSAAADQFDSTFFNQFERVTVADLHQTSATGSMINFDGVVTFVYRNGDIQTETRSFTVDTRTSPALITSSEFGRVLKPR